MTSTAIRVGIIGLSAQRGWARPRTCPATEVPYAGLPLLDQGDAGADVVRVERLRVARPCSQNGA